MRNAAKPKAEGSAVPSHSTAFLLRMEAHLGHPAPAVSVLVVQRACYGDGGSVEEQDVFLSHPQFSWVSVNEDKTNPKILTNVLTWWEILKDLQVMYYCCLVIEKDTRKEC